VPYTRDQYRSRLELSIANTAYYDNFSFNDSIQDGYDEISAIGGLYIQSAAVNYIANKTYYDLLTILPNYLGIIAIFNAGIRRWMFPSSLRKFNIDRIDWETAVGVPYYFSVVSHRYMAIYKKPSNNNYGQMYIFYHASAPTLAGTDTLSIPDQFITVLEDYCITDLWEQNQEWTKAANHFEAYTKNLERLKTWVKSNRYPDRLSILKG
jgi:hypothetical protein